MRRREMGHVLLSAHFFSLWLLAIRVGLPVCAHVGRPKGPWYRVSCTESLPLTPSFWVHVIASPCIFNGLVKTIPGVCTLASLAP